MSKKYIIPQQLLVTKTERQRLKRHKSAILWFTGLPSSGKSTLASKLEQELLAKGVHTYVLDGDNIRSGLNKGLGFSKEDRDENIRRIGEVAKLFVDAGILAMTAFVSPYRQNRDMVRNLVEPGEFIEIFVKCPVAVCEQRDVKGLYKKAREGEIKNFTGIDDPYEEPLQPEITIATDELNLDDSIASIVIYLHEKGYIAG